MSSIPEQSYLLGRVEKRFNRKLETTTDFEALSVVIEHELNETISTSTLKRLWGYVSSRPQPRISTLDILSKFIGFSGFRDFCKSIRTSGELDSDFFSSKYIIASDMNLHDRIRIGWNPNRLVEIEYLGDSKWVVTSSVNAKLQIGDFFLASSFILGCPLFIPAIVRNDQLTPSYVAGSKDGLTVVEIVE